jgi:hypothetical protein
MRKKNPDNKYYFSDREENAFVLYISTKSVEERHKIYNEVLRKPFKKMIEIILRRYPIHIGNYEMSELESNALSHLIEHMVKFNPEKITKNGVKAKAFSYCQTIIRNYFKDHSKKSYNEKKTNLPWEDFSEEADSKIDLSYEMEDLHRNELEELIQLVIDKMKEKIELDKSLKKNEIIVGEAIINILTNWHLLFLEDTEDGKYQKKITNNFAKNKILLFLKEQSGLSTKEIRLSMKPFKEIYFLEKTSFFNDND